MYSFGIPAESAAGGFIMRAAPHFGSIGDTDSSSGFLRRDLTLIVVYQYEFAGMIRILCELLCSAARITDEPHIFRQHVEAVCISVVRLCKFHIRIVDDQSGDLTIFKSEQVQLFHSCRQRDIRIGSIVKCEATQVKCVVSNLFQMLRQMLTQPQVHTMIESTVINDFHAVRQFDVLECGAVSKCRPTDLFQILPEVDNYPMTYRALTDVAKQEQDAKARPAYAGEVNDLGGYETIFIGAPVWCDKVSFSSVHLLSGQSTWGLASRAAEPARACLSPCASLRFAHLSIFIVIYFNNQEKGFIL